MTALWSILTSRLAGPIASGVALLLAILLLAAKLHIGSLEHRNDGLTKANATLTSNLQQCRANTATLQAGIDAQNRAVEAVRAQGATRVAALEQSLVTARISAQTAQQRAAAILARRPGPDQCASALEAIRGN